MVRLPVGKIDEKRVAHDKKRRGFIAFTHQKVAERGQRINDVGARYFELTPKYIRPTAVIFHRLQTVESHGHASRAVTQGQAVAVNGNDGELLQPIFFFQVHAHLPQELVGLRRPEHVVAVAVAFVNAGGSYQRIIFNGQRVFVRHLRARNVVVGFPHYERVFFLARVFFNFDAAPLVNPQNF